MTETEIGRIFKENIGKLDGVVMENDRSDYLFSYNVSIDVLKIVISLIQNSSEEADLIKPGAQMVTHR